MSEPTPVWTLPAELATDDPTSAAALLSTYFHSRGSDGEPAYTGAVLRAAGCGPVTTGKLLARKRSRLLPVIDSVVKETLKHPRGQSFWLTLRHQLRVHDARLVTLLEAARAKAELGDSVSIICCFDVVAWLVGKRTWTPTTRADSAEAAGSATRRLLGSEGRIGAGGSLISRTGWCWFWCRTRSRCRRRRRT